VIWTATVIVTAAKNKLIQGDKMRKMKTLVTFIVLLLAIVIAPSAMAAKSSLNLGMVLDPPHLDPTAGAAAAIDEVVYANIFEGLTRIDKNGAHTVVVTLTQPTGGFLFNMGWGDAVIVDAASAAKNKSHPIGTGPFKFSKWVRG